MTAGRGEISDNDCGQPHFPNIATVLSATAALSTFQTFLSPAPHLPREIRIPLPWKWGAFTLIRQQCQMWQVRRVTWQKSIWWPWATTRQWQHVWSPLYKPQVSEETWTFHCIYSWLLHTAAYPSPALTRFWVRYGETMAQRPSTTTLTMTGKITVLESCSWRCCKSELRTSPACTIFLST